MFYNLTLFPRLLHRRKKLHHNQYKCQLLEPNLHYFNPVHTSKTLFFKTPFPSSKIRFAKWVLLWMLPCSIVCLYVTTTFQQNLTWWMWNKWLDNISTDHEPYSITFLECLIQTNELHAILECLHSCFVPRRLWIWILSQRLGSDWGLSRFPSIPPHKC